MKAVNLLISGKVQGVWYRAWTVEQAGLRGLRGWVRNLRDGRVEAVLCGQKSAVSEMMEACWQGPPLALVDAIEVSEADEPDNPGFEQRPTE